MAPDVERLTSRLEKVERENKRIRIGGLLALGVVMTVFLTGLSVEDPVIGAEAFTVVDARGEPRAVFAMVNSEPTLALFDSKGKVRIGMSVVEDSPRLILYDADGTAIWTAP